MDTLTASETTADAQVALPSQSAGEIVEARQAPAPVAGDDPFFAMIERAARDPAISVEKLERLFELSERARAVRAKQSFAEAFAAMLPELPEIERNGTIVIYKKADRDKPGGPTENDKPQQVTPYSTLPDILKAIRDPMAKHRFGISFGYATAEDGRIITTAYLRHGEGHIEAATTPPLRFDDSGSKNSVQQVGSSMSYGKRYALMAVLPIVSRAKEDADDDGKAAGGKPAGVITEEQFGELRALMVEANANEVKFLETYKVEQVQDLSPVQFKQAAALLRQKIARSKKTAA